MTAVCFTLLLLLVGYMYYQLTSPVKIKFAKLDPRARIPKKAHPSDAGLDISTIETYTLPPHHSVKVSTGIQLIMPEGYECQMRPRSGLASKFGLTLINSPGTIDANYRGEVCVLLHNASPYTRTVTAGDRIAQLVFAPVLNINVEECDVVDPDSTDRGAGGYGSTGK